jgi:predicted glycosyltransferase
MTILREQDWHGVLITGPYMAAADVEELRRHPAAAYVRVIRMTTDVPGYLAAADAVFCMGGYNTTCEVLAVPVPAVVVPRTTPRLEQLMRAQRLAGRGLLRLLHPDTLTPQAAADALAAAARTPRGTLRAALAPLARAGVQATALVLSELLARPSSAPTTPEASHAIS